MQSELRPIKLVKDPKAKAKQFVKLVIVIDGPACKTPKRNLSLIDKWMGVWSMALQTTNMSSTPIPISKKGKIAWIFDTFYSK